MVKFHSGDLTAATLPGVSTRGRKKRPGSFIYTSMSLQYEVLFQVCSCMRVKATLEGHLARSPSPGPHSIASFVMCMPRCF